MDKTWIVIGAVVALAAWLVSANVRWGGSPGPIYGGDGMYHRDR